MLVESGVGVVDDGLGSMVGFFVCVVEFFVV